DRRVPRAGAPDPQQNAKPAPAPDFEPIGLTKNAPAVIVARKDFPAENLTEFVAYLKENGGKLRQAHGGIGASSHMACLLFNQALGIRPTSVAYRGTGPAMNDLVGGHVDFLCEQSVSVAEQIKTGPVKGYVVSANQRLATLPDIPSAKEGGINYQMSIWAGIFAPKGTPKEIIAKLAAALDKALDDPSVRKRLGDLGGSVPAKQERTPASFTRLVKAEIALVSHSQSCVSHDELTHRERLIGWSGTTEPFESMEQLLSSFAKGRKGDPRDRVS